MRRLVEPQMNSLEAAIYARGRARVVADEAPELLKLLRTIAAAHEAGRLTTTDPAARRALHAAHDLVATLSQEIR